MLMTQGYAVTSPTSGFAPFQFERRELKPHDVHIRILYCGICHSDIHQVKNEWNNAIYPMVPGHEIVGRVEKVGKEVKKFKPDDLVGVGCFVDSCRQCASCQQQEEQFCEKHLALTYNSYEMDGRTPTYGGYSSQIVVDENYVLRLPKNLELANMAPLLCAGITTYSPLKRYQTGPGKRVAVVGLGGLGHMGVKLAAAMGAEVTVFSTSKGKEADARRLGAHHFVINSPDNLAKAANQFDFVLDAVSAPHDINLYLNLLRRGGVLTLVGVPEKPLSIQPFALLAGRRTLAGSLIGGIHETQEMLDFCSEKNIVSDIELIPIQKLAQAYERTIKGDVRYRFVIDMTSL